MKTNTKYIYFFLCAFVLFSCSEDEPILPDPSVVYTEPVFKLSGILDQEVLDIQAGEKNFYMYTDFEIDNSDVTTFIGRFAAEDGTSTIGDEELTFSIRGNMPFQSGSTILINEALTEGSLEYAAPASNPIPSYRYDFNSIVLSSSGTGPYDFLWEFSFGDTSTTDDPTLIIDSDSVFSANLTVSRNSGAYSNFIGLVSPDINSNLLLDLNYAFVTNNDVRIVVENQGLDLVWSTGETTDTIFVDLNQLNPDGELYTVTATNANGNQVLASVFVKEPLGLPVEVFTTLFQYEVTEIYTQDLDLGTVIIEYKKDGQTYSSNLGDQSPGKFSINLIEDFQINEIGLPTKKLQIAFEAILYNETGDSIPIEGDGFIGVAYPN